MNVTPWASPLAALLAQVAGPTEPQAELVKIALNAGVTGLFALYLYYNGKAQREERDRHKEDFAGLITRVEKMEERRIADDRIARGELIATLKEMQADNRDRSDKDRTLVRDVVAVMVEVKKVVESQEVTVRALDATIRNLQMEFQSFRSGAKGGRDG